MEISYQQKKGSVLTLIWNCDIDISPRQIGEAEYNSEFIPLPWVQGQSLPAGKYGRMREAYLKAHKKELYSALTLQGNLEPHLAHIDREVNKRIDALMEEVLRREQPAEISDGFGGLADRLSWGRHMDCLFLAAENIAITDLVCG